VFPLAGQVGQTYVIETSTDLAHWTAVSTNVLTEATFEITNAMIPGARQQFWRAVVKP